MKATWKKLTHSLHAFRGASAGNVAITFAIASLPIVGTIGFAVDYSHANAVKAAMQAALDSTALMLAKDAATTSNADLQTKALNYFNALFTRPEAKKHHDRGHLYGDRRLAGKSHRLGRGSNSFPGHHRVREHHRERRLHHGLGIDPAARRAGSG